MKESDRMLQWCVWRRTPIGGGPNAATGNATINALGQVQLGTCIGHACGQWRWDDDGLAFVIAPRPAGALWERVPGGDGGLQRVEPPRPPPVDASFTWNGALDRWEKNYGAGDRPGHCGVSGPVLYD